MEATPTPASHPEPNPKAAPEMAPIQFEEGSSLWKDAWRRLRKNRMAVVGAIILAILGTLCSLSPWISPYEYDATNLALGASPPSGDHWMGTDNLGRDLLTRCLYGGGISLLVGISATAVSLTIGVIYGATSAYIGGKVDSFMMRVVDILYALPFTIFVILLTVMFGRHIVLLFVAIGAVEWLTMARIVRSQTMSIKRMEFIEAALSLGLSKRRILLRHIIPNILGPIIVYATLTVPMVMLLEAFLSFLGLGVQPPMSSWGSLIKDGAEKMEEYPWLLLFPGGLFAMTLISLNFLGDGLRDAMDPRASKD